MPLTKDRDTKGLLPAQAENQAMGIKQQDKPIESTELSMGCDITY